MGDYVNRPPKNLIQGAPDLLDPDLISLILASADDVWYVDSNNDGTGVSTDGLTWDTAFATIQEAITAHNALIDWTATPMRYGAILAAPGVYDENLTPAYYCWLIGTGIQGTDTATEIHPTTGACLTGTLLGSGLINLWFETNDGTECCDIGICNNSEVAYNTFANGAAVATPAFTTDNCTHLHFHHNSVESGQTTGMQHGLYFQGGSNKYAHNVNVHDNKIITTDTGIYVAANCTSSEARFGPHNFIRCTGGSSIGVDENNGVGYVFGNWISANDAIEHAGGAAYTIGNSVVNNGTGAKEAANS
jgi:hypothetical protein